jgi:hypothetical protein
MSDFFEQILARSFGVTAEVRPRLPSRFEAADGGKFGAQEPALADVEAQAGDDARQKPRSSTGPTNTEPEEKAERPSPPRAVRPRPVVVPVPPETRTGLRPQPTDDSATASAPIPPRPRTDEDGRTSGDQPEVFERERRRPGPKDASATGGPPDSPVTDIARPTEAPRIIPRPALNKPVATPPIARDGENKAPANTVMVTIGRIKVSVAPAPPRPASVRRANAPPKPARSLDDYLRRRDGGQR